MCSVAPRRGYYARTNVLGCPSPRVPCAHQCARVPLAEGTMRAPMCSRAPRRGSSARTNVLACPSPRVRCTHQCARVRLAEGQVRALMCSHVPRRGYRTRISVLVPPSPRGPAHTCRQGFACARPEQGRDCSSSRPSRHACRDWRGSRVRPRLPVANCCRPPLLGSPRS